MNTSIPNPINAQVQASMVPAGAVAQQQESKTNDFRVVMSNKKGDLKSVGIFKCWKRFDESATQRILARLAEAVAEEEQTLITSMETENTSVEKDEF